MTRRLLIWLIALVVLAGACGARTASSPAVPTAAATPEVIPGGAAAISDTPGTPAADQSCNGGQPTASLAPQGALPAPGNMPAGSYMATIFDHGRGHLRAGVDQNTLLWGYRNPQGQLAGFDIEMVNQVAQAIFGPSWPQHIQYVIVPNADRVAYVAEGKVDILAETMTITCAREQEVDFSAEYYDAAQRILVPKGSPIDSIADLAGMRVCAAKGSTSLVNLTMLAPAAKQVAVVNQTDCLVMLQQGQVDAISTDDTILEGLTAQDPNLQLVKGVSLSNEPYGMAINKHYPEFTRFVNGVLAKEQTDHQWTGIWDAILGPVLHSAAPAPPTTEYRG